MSITEREKEQIRTIKYVVLILNEKWHYRFAGEGLTSSVCVCVCVCGCLWVWVWVCVCVSVLVCVFVT